MTPLSSAPFPLDRTTPVAASTRTSRRPARPRAAMIAPSAFFRAVARSARRPRVSRRLSRPAERSASQRPTFRLRIQPISRGRLAQPTGFGSARSRVTRFVRAYGRQRREWVRERDGQRIRVATAGAKMPLGQSRLLSESEFGGDGERGAGDLARAGAPRSPPSAADRRGADARAGGSPPAAGKSRFRRRSAARRVGAGERRAKRVAAARISRSFRRHSRWPERCWSAAASRSCSTPRRSSSLGAQCVQVLVVGEANMERGRGCALDRQLRAPDDRGPPTSRDRCDDANEWRIAAMSMTILTVDNSRTMRDMLKVALTEAGYRVVQAVDGMHGLEVLEQEAPRVIITDINMPKLDGFGFIERVRGESAVSRRSDPRADDRELDRRRRIWRGAPARRDGSSSRSTRSSSSTSFAAWPRNSLRNPRMDTMAAIRETFFQECEEQLGELEIGLLAMDEGDANSETVNAVFRAVHSIKGGAGAFKLDRLVRFAHTFETALDLIRSEQLAPSPAVMKTMLRSADVLADLVKAARVDEPIDEIAHRIADRRAEGPGQRSTRGGGPRQRPRDEAEPFDFQPVMLSFDDEPEVVEPAAATLHHRFRAEAGSLSQGQRGRAVAAGARTARRDRDRLRHPVAAAPRGSRSARRLSLLADRTVDDRGPPGDRGTVRVRRRRLRARNRRVSTRRFERGAATLATSAGSTSKRRRRARRSPPAPSKDAMTRRARAASTRTPRRRRRRWRPRKAKRRDPSTARPRRRRRPFASISSASIV